MGLADSKSCEADDGIEDAYHFFFQCERYSDNRDKLKQDIQRIWEGQILEEADHLVALLLAPSSVTAFTRVQNRAILVATFEFIEKSGRQLYSFLQ